MPDEPILISKRQAAQKLGIGLESLGILIQRGDIKVDHIGKRTKVFTSSIRAYNEKPVRNMTEAEFDRAWRMGRV